MTPTEVLKEIRKMPLPERRELLKELNGDLASLDPTTYISKEQGFIESMKKKGLISDVPNRMKGNATPKKFKRVNVIGKPISQTIIEDRG